MNLCCALSPRFSLLSFTISEYCLHVIHAAITDIMKPAIVIPAIAPGDNAPPDPEDELSPLFAADDGPFPDIDVVTVEH